jgi:chromosome segregation ATPase
LGAPELPREATGVNNELSAERGVRRVKGDLMSSLSEFFGRKGGPAVATAEKAPTLLPGKGPSGDDRPAETWAEIGSRIGSENELLRNLLVDTGRQVGALDDLKDAFGKLVDPINKTLRALEQEKSDNVSLRGTLADVRGSYEALRNEFNELGRRSAASETEVERLRHELEIVQQTARSAEISKMELGDELSAARGRAAEFERQLSLETNNARALADENRSLAEHASSVDKRIVELEGDLSAAKERGVLLDNEKRSLQNSLEQLVADSSKLTRRLNETDNTLANARTRLEQIETALTTSENERNKLTAAVDEANERRQAESNTLNMRLEAMQSRATAAEKLLGEVRQSLTARTEENRLSERKVVEVTIAKNTIEKKLEQLLASLQGQERQIRDLDGSRATLVERSSSLSKTVKSRETALARSEEKIQSLTDLIKKLEDDAEANRLKTEKRVEELSSALQRERMERAVADGALEATRKNYAELQRELAVERSGRREETKPELVASDETERKTGRAKVAELKSGEAKPNPEKVEPIIPS